MIFVSDPPKVRKYPADGRLLVRKGETVTLTCEGEGSPRPTITWSKVGKRMPDGSETVEGDSISFKSVNHHHSGTYECRANNGYGVEAVESIEVDVEYAPEVEVEEVFIHAAAGNKVELVCLVHAEPSPTVQWYKSGGKIELTDDSTSSMKRHGRRHILTFTNLREEDFGNYTCRAHNSIGQSQKVLEISGLAAFPDFGSRPAGSEPESFLLEWTAKSHTPISSFALKYRERGDSDWKHVTVSPSSSEQSGLVWAGKHNLGGLKAATRYEARVASNNDQGWSRPSRIFHFATFGVEPISDASRGRASGQLAPLFGLVLASMLLAKWF